MKELQSPLPRSCSSRLPLFSVSPSSLLSPLPRALPTLPRLPAVSTGRILAPCLLSPRPPRSPPSCIYSHVDSISIFDLHRMFIFTSVAAIDRFALERCAVTGLLHLSAPVSLSPVHPACLLLAVGLLCLRSVRVCACSSVLCGAAAAVPRGSPAARSSQTHGAHRNCIEETRRVSAAPAEDRRTSARWRQSRGALCRCFGLIRDSVCMTFLLPDPTSPRSLLNHVILRDPRLS